MICEGKNDVKECEDLINIRIICNKLNLSEKIINDTIPLLSEFDHYSYSFPFWIEYKGEKNSLMNINYIPSVCVLLSCALNNYMVSILDVSVIPYPKLCPRLLTKNYLIARKRFKLTQIQISKEQMVQYLLYMWDFPADAYNNAIKLVEENKLNIYDEYLLASVAVWTVTARKRKGLRLENISRFVNYPIYKIMQLCKELRKK